MRKARAIGRWAGLAVAVAVLGFGGSVASAAINPDSTTWEGSYEGDVNPVDDGWTDVNGGAAAGVELNTEGATDYATLTMDAGEYFHFYGVAGDKLDPKTNGGTAHEFRVRVRKSAYLYIYFWCTSDSGGPYRTMRTWLTTTNAYHTHTPGGVEVVTNLNADDWTVYRIINDDETMKIYKDGGGDPVGQVFMAGSDDARSEYLARMYSAGPIDVDLDYLRWTDGQSDEPVTPGDANLDGVVNDADLSLLLANWQQDATGDPDGGWGRGEFNATAPVEDADLSILLSNWTVAGQVPEPASAALLVLGFAGAALRRRKQ